MLKILRLNIRLHVWRASCLVDTISECLQGWWVPSLKDVFMFEGWMWEEGCPSWWRSSYSKSSRWEGFLRARREMLTEFSWFLYAWARYFKGYIGSVPCDPLSSRTKLTIVDVNASANLASHWMVRGRTVRNWQSDCIWKSHIPSEHSHLSRKLCWVTYPLRIHCVEIGNVDSAIDWRIEFTSGWQCRRYTPLNSIRKSILDSWSRDLSLHS